MAFHLHWFIVFLMGKASFLKLPGSPNSKHSSQVVGHFFSHKAMSKLNDVFNMTKIIMY